MVLVVILYTCIKILRFNICCIKSNVKLLNHDIYLVGIFILRVLMQGPKLPLFYSHLDHVWSL